MSDADDIPEGGLSHEDAEDNPDIEALLDLGYEQLNAFTEWVDTTLELGSRLAEQDSFNAEFLIDYLANHHQKSIADINEFDLRWFMFSHYIRKAQAEEEIEERLPESLHRFFTFLRREHQELMPDWVPGVLDDTSFYTRRRREYAALDSADERAWEVGFRAWCQELEDDLDTRCLWLPRELGDGLEWGDAMGWRESTLHREANENWQRERAELLRSGLDYEEAHAHLLQSYEAWMNTPQSRLDEESPLETIQAERLEREELTEAGEDRFEDEEI